MAAIADSNREDGSGTGRIARTLSLERGEDTPGRANHSGARSLLLQVGLQREFLGQLGAVLGRVDDLLDQGAADLSADDFVQFVRTLDNLDLVLLGQQLVGALDPLGHPVECLFFRLAGYGVEKRANILAEPVPSL